jgi:hypothetical protein
MDSREEEQLAAKATELAASIRRMLNHLDAGLKAFSAGSVIGLTGGLLIISYLHFRRRDRPA